MVASPFSLGFVYRITVLMRLSRSIVDADGNRFLDAYDPPLRIFNKNKTNSLEDSPRLHP